MSLYIGVDIGGTVTKAGLYNTHGQEIFISEKSTPVIRSGPGVTERDMNELWSTVCELIKRCCDSTKEPVNGVSFSSHGKGLYAIDRNGNPVRNGIISSDSRAESIVKKWQEDDLSEETYERGLQQVWTAHPVTLMSWMKMNEPDNYEKVDRILMVHDYIRFKLTGEINAEITNISGSNMYNVREGRYDETLLADFGIEECAGKLAPTVESAEQSGVVTKEASALTGLKAGTPVYGGLFDVVAASLTSCVEDESVISAVAGTWSITTCVVDNISVGSYPYVWGNYCIPGKYFVHEGSPTSASNLAWFKSQFLDDIPMDEINRWIRTGSVSEEKLYFLPYLYGSNYQLGMPGSLVGLQGHHTKKDVINAIYEGIVFAHLNHQDRIMQLNPDAKTIRFTGGPTQSVPWMSLFTDASGIPVEVVDIKQSGCRAAALCAAVGNHEYQDFSEAMQATLPPVKRFEPNLANYDKLRSKFQCFNHINECLSEFSI